MINTENINAVESLVSLSDEQKQAIVSLSEASDTALKNTLYAEINNNLDKTVLDLTGVEKGGSEKTSEYISRIIADGINYKKQADTTIADLNDKIAKGATDSELKKQYEQATADLEKARKDARNYKDKYDQAVKDGEAALFGYKVNTAISEAMGGLTFSDTFSPEAVKLIKETVSKEIATLNPFFTEDGKLAFRDSNGAMLMDTKGNYAPHTAETLLKEKFAPYGILASVASGMGGKNGMPQGISALGGAATKTEAYSFIEKQLADRGIMVGTIEYTTEKGKLLQRYSQEISKLQ